MGQDHVGSKVRHFRQMKKMSQFQLEIEIGASPGSISRIENGVINPTKETLLKVADVLKLNTQQCGYLLGVTEKAAEEDEIKEVNTHLKQYLENPNILAYVSDDRWRMISISKGFQSVLGVDTDTFNQFTQSIILKTLIQLMVDDRFGVTQLFNSTHLKEIIAEQLPIYFNEVGSFMVHDKIYQETVNAIERNDFALSIWEKLNSGELKNDSAFEDIIVKFQINDTEYPYKYKRISLYRINPRFEIIEYQQI